MPSVPDSVLIVEDDPISAQALLGAIKLKCANVKWARTLAEAMTHIEESPGAVVLDLSLPDGSGVDFLKAFREAGHEDRVIVTTGADSGVARDVLKYRVEAILAKPVSLKTLFFLLGM